MNADAIKEYRAIISGYFTRATTDREAVEKLATFSKNLRADLSKTVELIRAIPTDPLLTAYLGAMFYGAVKTTDLKQVKSLDAARIDGKDAIAALRNANALQFSAEATPTAAALLNDDPDLLWIAIRLVLLHPIQKTWGAHLSESTEELTPANSNDHE